MNKHDNLKIHPASQSASDVPVSAAAGDDVREGSRSRTDGAGPRVRLYNASGVAAFWIKRCNCILNKKKI